MFKGKEKFDAKTEEEATKKKKKRKVLMYPNCKSLALDKHFLKVEVWIISV